MTPTVVGAWLILASSFPVPVRLTASAKGYGGSRSRTLRTEDYVLKTKSVKPAAIAMYCFPSTEYDIGIPRTVPPS